MADMIITCGTWNALARLLAIWRAALGAGQPAALGTCAAGGLFFRRVRRGFADCQREENDRSS